MDALRRRSRWLARAISLVLVILLSVPLVLAFAIAFQGYPHTNLLVRQLPMLFYAWALWTIAQSLAGFANGGQLGTLDGSIVQRVGWSLFLGGLADVFAVPVILRIIRGEGSIAFFLSSAITIGAIGLALLVIGRLLADAQAAQRELDEFI